MKTSKYKIEKEDSKTIEETPKVKEQLAIFYSPRLKFESVYTSHIKEDPEKNKYRDRSFDYENVNTSWGVHGIHPYPAMMIFPIARRLILEFTNEGDIVLDPFMGSGSVLVESLLHGRNAYGIDINPLALLLAKVKTTPLKTNLLIQNYQRIINSPMMSDSLNPPEFFNIDFWFKKDVTIALTHLLENINKLENQNVKDFFKVAFSETVRIASNTETGEFKLLRKKEFEKHNPKVSKIFKEIVFKNISKMDETYNNSLTSWSKIMDHDSREKIPIEPNSVDLILTSPPYGDSRTTVAYGQFSRLSLQWLGYEKVNIDRESLGGIPCKYLDHDIDSPTLKENIHKILETDEKRAREVLSFYIDLNKCFENLAPLLKRNGYFCAVVGNRRVKKVTIRTDEIIAELIRKLNFYHIKTIIRAIPTKRMPKINSPTNVEGQTETTMNEEYIVILKKGK